MRPASIKELLQQVKQGHCSIEEALERLRLLPYEDLGFARLDHHRHLRQGFPEVIFCQGKSTPQIQKIVKHILAAGSDLLATRAAPDVFRAVSKLDSRIEYNELAAAITLKQQPRSKTIGQVLVISAGTSDIQVAEEAVVTADMLGSKVERLYDVGVAGIHRLLDQEAKLSQARVIVVVAGMEGALASVVGGLVDKPLIAVPTSVGYGTSIGGLAALFSMLNSCAAGVGVVNIDNGFGAGCLAHRINKLGGKNKD
jgi:NCAIR mutase (PurE)-related protein